MTVAHVVVVTGPHKVNQAVARTALPATVRLVGKSVVKKSQLVTDQKNMRAALLDALSSSEAGDQVQVESRKGAR